jgi:anthranilate synthase component 1
VPRISWTYHIQAAGGIVLDSRADAEFDETVSKAAALARAIDVAEEAFARSSEARTVHPAEEPR